MRARVARKQQGGHVLVFTGTYEHAIDAKNRLAVPAEIRALLAREARGSHDEPMHWLVTLGEKVGDDQGLCLYTEEGFARRADELDHSELEAEELLAYERLMFSLARRVEMDRQGRVRLPDNLLKMTGLGGDVVLIGVKDHLEIRDRDKWQRHVASMLAQRPDIVANPRRLMRRRRET
jgi:MraZ protein